jgi:hypothetical protein
MDNGPTSTESEETPQKPDEEELFDLSVPLEPAELFEEGFVDGVLDIDKIRDDDELADPAPPSATQTVARATGDESTTASTLDAPLPPLPIIDVHCHIHGVSLSKSKTSLKNFEQHGIFNGNDLSTQKKRNAYQKSLKDYHDKTVKYHSQGATLNFAHWNFKDDPWVAKKIIQLTQRFQNETNRFDAGHPIAITPMLLDFGYTPLGTSAASKGAKLKGSGSSMKESEARKEEAADTGIFYFSKSSATEKNHRFFTRDTEMFEHQIEILHLISKLWPGQIFPFCPYDPRRPDCLDHVKKAMDTQGYVGVKLYARCGWRPYDNAALHGDEVGATLDARLDEFYTYVTANDIPILNHTSPTGHPPDGALVLPWRMTPDANQTERDEASGASPMAYPPTNWAKPDRFVKGRTKKQKSLEKMTYELNSFAYYCLYDQLTTAPYSWEPVLTKYPTLRLCFAHFGSKLGVYANPRYNTSSSEIVEDCENLLVKNPMVAGATGHRKFRDYFKKGAIYNRNNHKLDDDYARDSAISLLAEGQPWGDWVSTWEETYPDDWSTKITKLVTQYENVYADISFITGSGKAIADIIDPVFEDALKQRAEGKRLFDKCMIGTDWYMTEISGLSPCDFWRLVQKSCKMDPALYEELPAQEKLDRLKVWEYWSSKNAFRYLNIKPRLQGAGMDKLVAAYGCEKSKLPSWWKTLEKSYDEPEEVEPPDPDGGVV